MPEPRTVKIQIQLPEDLRTRFKAKCVVTGTTMNQALIELVEAWTEGRIKEGLAQAETEAKGKGDK